MARSSSFTDKILDSNSKMTANSKELTNIFQESFLEYVSQRVNNNTDIFAAIVQGLCEQAFSDSHKKYNTDMLVEGLDFDKTFNNAITPDKI